MKSTGITRKLDELGRITLPMELRRSLGYSSREELEIFVENGGIVLRKNESVDIFTGDKKDLIEFHGKKVSKKNIIELAKLAGILEQ